MRLPILGRTLFIASLSLPCLSSQGIALQNSGSERRGQEWRLVVGAEYLAAANNKSTLLDTAERCKEMLRFNSGSGGPCSITSNAAGAQGLRASFFRSLQGFDLGFSGSYLTGGPGVGNTILRLAVPSYGYIASSADTLRALGEARKTWPLWRALRTRLGAGAGVAVENQTISVMGVNSGASFAKHLSLGWLTWELSPALVVRNCSLGFRYTGFARGSHAPWHAMGGFFSIDF
jgi:hypothetical protein